MATRTQRFAGPTLITVTTPVVLWECPLGRIDLMKVGRYVNVTGSEVLFDLCIDVHDEDHALLWRAPCAGGDLVIDRVWQPIHPGESVLIKVDVPNAITATCAGARLVGEPT